jgi:hypothetical protein
VPRIECMHMHLHIPRTCMHCMHHLFRGLLFVPQGLARFPLSAPTIVLARV